MYPPDGQRKIMKKGRNAAICSLGQEAVKQEEKFTSDISERTAKQWLIFKNFFACQCLVLSPFYSST